MRCTKMNRVYAVSDFTEEDSSYIKESMYVTLVGLAFVSKV
jgi:hypothetical protein